MSTIVEKHRRRERIRRLLHDPARDPQSAKAFALLFIALLGIVVFVLFLV